MPGEQVANDLPNLEIAAQNEAGDAVTESELELLESAGHESVEGLEDSLLVLPGHSC